MKINRTYDLALHAKERDAVIDAAKEIGEDISESEYIELIEQMLFDAFMLGMEEPKQKGDI